MAVQPDMHSAQALKPSRGLLSFKGFEIPYVGPRQRSTKKHSSGADRSDCARWPLLLIINKRRKADAFRCTEETAAQPPKRCMRTECPLPASEPPILHHSEAKPTTILSSKYFVAIPAFAPPALEQRYSGCHVRSHY